MKELAKNVQDARDRIAALENGMALLDSDIDIDEQTFHMFAPNLYSRTLKMKAGQSVVGKIHKTEHLFAVQSGRCRVFSETEGLVEYEGPMQMITKIGTKRAVLALTDCILTTYHPTRETDVDKIEEKVIARSFDELEALTGPDGLLMLEAPL
tara:strand:- start:1974 stop:2432 length:459 start_codon:yes stop_codon:yes gene_type:complete